MLIETAESFFQGRSGIAKALGDNRSVSAVYQWWEVVPLAAARRLEELSSGQVRVVESMYDELGRAIHKRKNPNKKPKFLKKRRRAA
jgi:hypothetical protein